MKNTIAFLALLCTSFQLFGQTLADQNGPTSSKENSPYSRYGIGNLSNSQNANFIGIGGSATAANDYFSVNSFNPASYSFLKTTSLDFALQASSRSVFMNNKNFSSSTMTFGYLALAMPLGEHLGLAFGLKPYSTMYYNTSDTIWNPNIGKTAIGSTGSGGLNQAYLGFSGKWKGLSLGLNGGYTFGNLNHAESFQILEAADSSLFSRQSEFRINDQIGGLFWKAGILYQIKFKKDHFINIAATADFSHQLNTKTNGYNLAYSMLGQDILNIDTISKVKDKKGQLTMPSNYSFGLSIGKELGWSVVTDFQYADWSKYQLNENRIGIGDQAWRASIGGELTPSGVSESNNYFSNVNYKLGFYYGKDNLNIAGHSIDYMAATVGLSLPLKRHFSQFGSIHMALDVGKRGMADFGLARELYTKFTIGLSLNDIWFQRPKYN